MATVFPEIEVQRLACKVTNTAETMLKKEHPWVFESSITKVNKAGKAGDLAIIFDRKKNKFLAAGLWDPFSPIRIKIIQFKNAASIDNRWVQQKLESAYELRRPLFETDTNGYRLVHGENDSFPGLIIDVYDQVVVIKMYSAIWMPYLTWISDGLRHLLSPMAIVIRFSRQLQQMPSELYGLKEGQLIFGILENDVVQFKEHGLTFATNVIDGHKTGFFLDHRANRLKVQQLSKGKRVLDVFSYAGGFSVHALAGGAQSVLSLDISAQALKMAKHNVGLNFGGAHQHDTMAMDAFEGLQQLADQRQKFDLIIIDPPSFAKQQSEQKQAIQTYGKLMELALPLVVRGGVILAASCSSRINADTFFGVVEQVFQSAGRLYTCLEKTFHDVDHPIAFPEGAYLKSGYYRFD